MKFLSCLIFLAACGPIGPSNDCVVNPSPAPHFKTGKDLLDDCHHYNQSCRLYLQASYDALRALLPDDGTSTCWADPTTEQLRDIVVGALEANPGDQKNSAGFLTTIYIRNAYGICDENK